VNTATAVAITSIGSVQPSESWCSKPISGAELAAMT